MSFGAGVVAGIGGVGQVWLFEEGRHYWRRHRERFPRPPVRGDYPTRGRWNRAVVGWFAAVDEICAEIARELAA